ncbi:PAS domain-containing sensor histidine kinase [Dyadobacter fermentans]|nr:PAS domain-containing sensor histidine kinase [Dyadobacter fermentans]
MESQRQWSSLFENIGSDHSGPDLLFRHLPMGICFCDATGTITYGNAMSQVLWGAEGIPSQKFCGSHRLLNADGSLLLFEDSPVAICLRENRPVAGFDLTMERRDGSVTNVSSNVSPVYNNAGDLLGAVNCFHENTSQNAAQQALSRKTFELQEYIDNASIGLHWVDHQGIIKWANQAELDMLGYTREEYVGHHISTFHLHLDKINDILRRLQEDEVLNQYESEMVCKDGSIRVVHISSSVFRQDGQFVHTRCFTVDVTTVKQAELQLMADQLQIMNKKLEKSNKELQDFAYVASHDLQEPLRKITALGTLLVNRHSHALSPDGTNLVIRMQAASNRMNILIEDLLHLSQVSSVKEKTRVNLHEEINGVLMDLESAITAKGAEIHLEDLYPMNGYAPQIRQLFQNLIGNALKFSRPGAAVVVRISSQLVRGADSGFRLFGLEAEKQFQLIEIKDNGIGFEPKYAQDIFEVFRRLNGKHEFAGTGIGLSIVKKVIENHQGHILAEGRKGDGATFRILLPTLE